MRTNTAIAGVLATAALWVAVAVPAFAQGSRLSLADRVARLEQQQAAGNDAQANIQQLNQVSELQAEVATLRGMIEQQAFEIESLQKRNRDQYIDLDARLARIESGSSSMPTGGETPVDQDAPMAAEDVPLGRIDGTPVGSPDSPVMQEPEIRAPLDAEAGTSGIGSDIEPQVAEAPASPEDERRAYDGAFNELKEGRYAEAARQFQSFLRQFPEGDYTPNAHYWLGESYYVTQNYEIALDSFNQLLQRFPNSTKAPDALLKLGYCQYELRQWAEAEATLNRVIQQYPDTTVARLAQGRLRALRLESRS
ncbi:MAG: tol-pal system protein YbgF [Xanthomonadales bacterium]|nr:tol-pal system protein YbgF [Xanthomonadales bacterium]